MNIMIVLYRCGVFCVDVCSYVIISFSFMFLFRGNLLYKW